MVEHAGCRILCAYGLRVQICMHWVIHKASQGTGCEGIKRESLISSVVFC